MKFTYDAYIKLLDKLAENGYAFADYENYKKYDQCVILRHDVDASIDKAFVLAEIEYKKRIKSTYFLLVSSPFYNVLSRDAREKIIAISRMGHNIGLHFDELNYPESYYQTQKGIKFTIEQEIGIMKTALGLELKYVSMHRPSKETLAANYDLFPYINSYAQEFFKNFKYISDSRRFWREDVLKLVETNAYKRLHILTHAFWYNAEEKSLSETILSFVKNGNIERYELLEKNITNLQQVLDRGQVISIEAGETIKC